MMLRFVPARRPLNVFAVCCAVFALPAPVAAESPFPFGQELLLDAKPLPGSKRVPSLEIGTNGATSIDLWCNRMQGQIVVAANTITILRGPVIERQCTPERMSRDEDMLSALLQATNWHRDGDIVILEGGKRLRFRISTN